MGLAGLAWNLLWCEEHKAARCNFISFGQTLTATFSIESPERQKQEEKVVGGNGTTRDNIRLCNKLTLCTQRSMNNSRWGNQTSM